MTDLQTANEGRGASQTLLPMAEIDERLRVSVVRQQMVPMECRSSWLLPLLTGGAKDENRRLYLTGFLYPVMGQAGQPKRVLRPRFQWSIDPSTGRLVEIVDCRFRDFGRHIASGEELGVLTPDMLPAQTVPELQAFRAEMMRAFDAVLPIVFAPQSELDQDARAAASRLKQMLARGIEPFLLPFYRALDPAIFEWLDQF